MRLAKINKLKNAILVGLNQEKQELSYTTGWSKTVETTLKNNT